MKNYIFTLIAIVCAMSSNAQIMQIYKDGQLLKEYKSSEANKVLIKEEIIDTHEYVDLGLPSGTKWATCNIGATKREDLGDFFAWGETEAKNTFSINNYKYYKTSTKIEDGIEVEVHGYTKYVRQHDLFNIVSGYDGFYDNKTTLDPEDDAAFVLWGSDWKIPSKEEMQELIDNCTWTYGKSNNVYGYLVKAKNGNSIFLPKDDGSNLVLQSKDLYSLNSLDDDHSYYMKHLRGDGIADSGIRYLGWNIRPVTKGNQVSAGKGNLYNGIFVTVAGSETCYMLKEIPTVTYSDTNGVKVAHLKLQGNDKPVVSIELQNGATMQIVYGVYENTAISGIKIDIKEKNGKKYISGGNLIIIGKDGKKYNANGIEIK